jgi:polysaccharide pyruvyl transferase CsaB
MVTDRSPLTLTLLGYYGFNNLGDDLLLAQLMQTLHELAEQGQLPEPDYRILSQHPQQTALQYPHAQVMHRFRPWGLVQALWGCQWLILGGGGLFQDKTSLSSVVYYTGVVMLARVLGAKVIWWGQGLGPLQHPLAKGLTAMALKLSHLCLLRDADSLALGQGLAPAHRSMVQVADPAWLFSPLLHEAGGHEADVHEADANVSGPVAPDAVADLITTGSRHGVRVGVGVSLRAWPDLTPVGITALAHGVESYMQRNATPDGAVVLLVFQPAQDQPILQQFAEAITHINPLRPLQWQAVDCSNVLQQMATLQAVVAMRFHAVLLASLCQTPVFAVSYDPKVQQLAQRLNLPLLPVHQLGVAPLVTVCPGLANPTALAHQQAMAQHGVSHLQNAIGRVIS